MFQATSTPPISIHNLSLAVVNSSFSVKLETDSSVILNSLTILDNTVNDTAEEGTIRLMGGATPAEGRVVIFLLGHWGTICDSGWDSVDATVVCHQLGYLGAVGAPGSAAFGAGSGPSWFSGVSCAGNEHKLTECNHNEFSGSACLHSHDAGVICSSENEAGIWDTTSRVLHIQCSIVILPLEDQAQQQSHSMHAVTIQCISFVCYEPYQA